MEEIPFEIRAKRTTDHVYEECVRAFANIRKMAEVCQLPDLTLEEINEEIRSARKDRAAKEQ